MPEIIPLQFLDRLVDLRPSLLRHLGPYVDGIEVTQAIQRYKTTKHLTDAQDHGATNSVTLAAYKAAYVRVYLRAGISNWPTPVTGTLTVERRSLRAGLVFGYSTVATLSPVGLGKVTAQRDPAYATERGALGNTLNFIIPANDCWGTLRLTANLTDLPEDSKTVEVDARLVQTLRVRGILIRYRGPSTAQPPAPGTSVPTIDLPAPTLADLQETATESLACMPVQATGSFASIGVLNWGLPLDDTQTVAGICSDNWQGLLRIMALMRTNDGNRNDVVYYGLLPNGMSMNALGCGDEGLGVAANGNRSTMVHELGHAYGFRHTACGNVGSDTETAYPTANPYPAISIGEYGLDIRRGDIHSPWSTSDYMSYCRPRWMSLYHHNRLLQHPRLAPRWIHDMFRPIVRFDPKDLWWPDRPFDPEDPRGPLQRVISIVGEVSVDGSVSIGSVARVSVAGGLHGPSTGWSAQLLDEEGAVLAAGDVRRLGAATDCGCGGGGSPAHPDKPPFSFQAFVPDVAVGAVLRLHDGEEVRWTKERPDADLSVTGFAAEVEDGHEPQLHLRWEADAREAWAQWREVDQEMSEAEQQRRELDPDHERPWHGLAVDLVDGQGQIPITGLPSGLIELRLLAHDGFATAISDPLTIELPEQPAVVAILHPWDGEEFLAGAPIQLHGNATTADGRPIDDEAIGWHVDGEEHGRGREVWLDALQPGTHEVTLVVRTDRGEEQRSVRIEVLD
ncbi:MAG: hypothetical protein Q4G46_07920 [Propionibacteriaceae bacterium]|nr:hypothetical protein [Propionibacteriaceae bacterium]